VDGRKYEGVRLSASAVTEANRWKVSMTSIIAAAGVIGWAAVVEAIPLDLTLNEFLAMLEILQRGQTQ